MEIMVAEDVEQQVLEFIDEASDDTPPSSALIHENLRYIIYHQTLADMEIVCLRRLIIACDLVTMSHRRAMSGHLHDILEVFPSLHLSSLNLRMIY